MKKLVPELDISPSRREEISRLAAKLALSETTVGLLFARGCTDEESMRAFLTPGKEHFLSPFLLKNMREAVELITRAREEEWSVAVFGDYDADGIGACAVLSRALRAFGIEPYLFVPERADGYGMSIPALDRIFDACMPDLIITVDCGISNAKEVEYIQEQGTYVIVTDHHELPDELPHCIVVNPKLGGDYPYDNLCGAGVAFKLACALLGEKAYPLIDFAALSTVADSVPLLGENRDIVAEGLKRIAETPRPCFFALLGKTDVSAQTLAFTLAPRINAAGRMGDANAALRLFTTEREEEIAPLAEKLSLYNLERQRCCDELYTQASAKIRADGAYGNVVMLAGEDWNAGFVGIVAARVAEEFGRPALLFVRHGDMLRGSARSIEKVNIFEALKNCSEYIEEFGGHSQAAGVNIRAENFEKLRAALDEYIGKTYAREDFEPVLTVCGEGEGMALARELNLLEPFGMGNRRPLFTLRTGKLEAAPIKPASPHLAFSAEGMDFMYFGGARDERLLNSDVPKTLVYEYNLSHFRGREYCKGFVRAVLFEGMRGKEVELDAFETQLKEIGSPYTAETMGAEELNAFLAARLQECAYGLAAVCFDRAVLSRYPALRGLPVEVFHPTTTNVSNLVLYAPEEDCDLSSYREVVLLDAPAGLRLNTGKARVIKSDIAGNTRLKDMDPDRALLLEIFAAVRRTRLVGESFAAMAKNCGGLGFSEEQLIFALSVFEELGLVERVGAELRIVRGKHTELTQSGIYSAAVALREA